MRFILAIAIALGLGMSAVEAKGPKTDQQRLMVSCNKYWHVYMKENGLKGKDRKAYLASCLKGEITVPDAFGKHR